MSVKSTAASYAAAMKAHVTWSSVTEVERR